MPGKYEGLPTDQIIQQLILLCMRHPQSAKEVLRAIKFPHTIAEIMNTELRELLEEWRTKSFDDEKRAALRAVIKTALPPRSSQYIEGLAYPGNPAEICIWIVFVWLRAQLLYQHDDRPHPKRRFYEASSTMSTTAIGQWKEQWMGAMGTLLPPGSMHPNFVWTCENIFRTEAIFCILLCLWQDLPRQMTKLVRALELEKCDGFIVISLGELNHTMALTVKIHNGYVTLRFFDPNAIHADLGIRLSPSESASWPERIFDLTRQAGVLLDPNTDCTITCLCKTRFSSLLTNWKEVQAMPPQKCAWCIYGFLAAIGGESGDYLSYVGKLITHISPKYLARPFNNGTTVLFMAAQNRYLAIVRQILKWTSRLSPALAQSLLQPRADGTIPLFIAAQYGHEVVVSMILEAASRLSSQLAQSLLQPRHDDGATALLVAAQYGYVEIVGRILEAASRLPPALAQSLLQSTHDGTTALFFASYNGHASMVGKILETVSASTFPPMLAQSLLQPRTDGSKPLFIAAQNGHKVVVSMILETASKLPSELQHLLQ